MAPNEPHLKIRNPLSVARGGPAPLGADPSLLEVNVGKGRRVDPSRDILVFWRYMIQGLAHTMKDRRIPVLREEFERNPDLEARAVAALNGLITAMSTKVESYDEFAANWGETLTDPEAADLIMKLVGRSCMQFYMECALVRGVPEDQIWPLGMDHVINEIIAAPNWPQTRPSRWTRLKRLGRSLIAFLAR